MRKKFFENIEWKVLIYPLILFIIGLIALYSATKPIGLGEFKKQLNWGLVSIPFLIIFTILDYNLFAKASIIGYILFLILLVGVLFMPSISGANSWYDLGPLSFQPSEIGKIFFILFISYLLSVIQKRRRENINNVFYLLFLFFVLSMPLFLIIKQPDYGTALAYIVAFLSILFIGGLSIKYILFSIIFFVIGVYFLFLKIIPIYAPHALKRIEVFLNPMSDPLGSGYNIIQSILAVGSGYVFGMGIFKGVQTQLGYLYPKTTDFIFSLISEEMGFTISALVVIVYILLIQKGLEIAKTSKDNVGEYIAMGITAIFFYHMVENISMTIGLLPITGIPLPFVSYGGSSLVTNFISIGLLLNISARRRKIIYLENGEGKNIELEEIKRDENLS